MGGLQWIQTMFEGDLWRTYTLSTRSTGEVREYEVGWKDRHLCLWKHLLLLAHQDLSPRLFRHALDPAARLALRLGLFAQILPAHAAEQKARDIPD